MTVADHRPLTATSVFARVLVGVDGSPAGREAVRQAGRLVAPRGTLELAKAIYLIEANLQRWPQDAVDAALEREGGPALAEAAALVGARATTRLLNGPPRDALLAEAERLAATLVAVGSHGHSLLSEAVIGGVVGPLLHEAPCSVLIARPPLSEATFPLTLVVGLDGSPGSLEALTVAEGLGRRFSARLRIVLARHGHVDVARAELRAPELELVDGSPVDVLVDAAAAADLLVVGSRGLRGLRAFGSVSERVAHRACSSVLVVRPPRRPARTAPT